MGDAAAAELAELDALADEVETELDDDMAEELAEVELGSTNDDD
jgi:hypothetical protein